MELKILFSTAEKAIGPEYGMWVKTKEEMRDSSPVYSSLVKSIFN